MNIRDNIFNINPSFNTKNSSFYGLIGEEDFIDDSGNPRISSENSPKIMAKTLNNKPSKHMGAQSQMQTRYYIRLKSPDTLYNPIPLETTIKDKDPFDFINNTCKDGSNFQEVTPATFDKYITF